MVAELVLGAVTRRLRRCADRSSSADTVAVPSFMTTKPAAMLASCAPSSGGRACGQGGREHREHGIAGAGDIGDLVGAEDRDVRGRRRRSSARVIPWLPRVASRNRAPRADRSSAAALGHLVVATEPATDGDLEFFEVGRGAVDSDEFADPIPRIEGDPGIASERVAQSARQIRVATQP